MIDPFTVRHLDGVTCQYRGDGELIRVLGVGLSADAVLSPEEPQAAHVNAANQVHREGRSAYLTAVQIAWADGVSDAAPQESP